MTTDNSFLQLLQFLRWKLSCSWKYISNNVLSSLFKVLLFSLTLILVCVTSAKAQSTSFYLPYPNGVTYMVAQSWNGGKSHYGTYNQYAVDFEMSEGKAVAAVASGRVIRSSRGIISGNIGACNSSYIKYARYIVIDHGNNISSLYLHLSEENVSVGDVVVQGQIIGKSGATGYVCGAHLHFTFEKTDTLPANNPYGTSLPIGFVETGNVAPFLMTYTSKNSSLPDSKVFNPKQYLSFYPDLQKAFGTNYQAATNHWLTYGISEGRRGSQVFDPKFYLGTYPDLQQAFGATNYQAAITHWLTHGISEGRKSSPAFDVRYYLGTYPDLQQAFGATNYQAAITHWLTHGIPEGRRSSPTFDVRYYLATYPDLQQAFGVTNYEAAITHWLTHGILEGRRGTSQLVLR